MIFERILSSSQIWVTPPVVTSVTGTQAPVCDLSTLLAYISTTLLFIPSLYYIVSMGDKKTTQPTLIDFEVGEELAWGSLATVRKRTRSFRLYKAQNLCRSSMWFTSETTSIML